MTRPTLGESSTERLHMLITADEIKAIDDWQFARRVQSRSEAVRRLIHLGLQSDRLAMIAELRRKADELEAMPTTIGRQTL